MWQTVISFCPSSVLIALGRRGKALTFSPRPPATRRRRYNCTQQYTDTSAAHVSYPASPTAPRKPAGRPLDLRCVQKNVDKMHEDKWKGQKYTGPTSSASSPQSTSIDHTPMSGQRSPPFQSHSLPQSRTREHTQRGSLSFIRV